ncbi:MAG: molybdopterin-dependent oxidoreductase [Fidelibacterota bacterium]
MEINRREFLKLLGITGTATVAGLGTAHLLLDIPEKVFNRIHTGSLLESWKTSLCTKCSGGCGIRIRLIDNIPVNITGNPDYPINRGAICPLAASGIETIFHPDRIKQPLKQTGSRGSDEWVGISWEEATDILTNRLQQLMINNTMEKLALITDDGYSLSSNLIQKIFKTMGCSNVMYSGYHPSYNLAAGLAHGETISPTYDFTNTDFILNFDFDALDEPLAPVYFNHIYGNSQAKIIHLSSYQSRTAVKSTEWHPIKVGTGGALALGIANVIVRDGTYDSTFIRNHSFGFDDWTDNNGQSHLGFKQFVLSEYSPEKVSDITGLASEIIIDLARQFALSKRGLAIGGGQLSESTNGVYSQYAVYCLNALKGNINKKGGIRFPELSHFPDNGHLELIDNEKNIARAENTFEHLLSKTEAGEDVIDTLFIQQSDPVSMGKRLHRIKRFINNIPFVVYVGSFKNESALQADLILPEPGDLERWNASFSVPTVDFPHFVVQQPVMERVDDTRPFVDTLLKIGKSLNQTMKKKLPWNDELDYIKYFAQAIYNSGNGVIVSEIADYSWVEYLKERGWQPMKHSSFYEFWNLLLENGGWWDPGYDLRETGLLFNNESGKFEFYSSFLENAFQQRLQAPGSHGKVFSELLNELHIEARGDYVYLPHYEKPVSHNINFPVQLIPFWLIGNWDQSGAELRLVQEMSGLHSREYWRLWAELNPETAKLYDIAEDDMIDITTDNRSLTVKVKIRPTVMPDSVVLPLGRFFGNKKENIYELFSEDMDELSGFPSLYSTRVRIRKSTRESQV